MYNILYIPISYCIFSQKKQNVQEVIKKLKYNIML